MIDIHAPITIHQFDETRFARMEEALANMRSDVEQMREELQAVLAKRQADIDAVTAQLKLQNDSLALAVSNAQTGTTAAKQPKEK